MTNFRFMAKGTILLIGMVAISLWHATVDRMGKDLVIPNAVYIERKETVHLRSAAAAAVAVINDDDNDDKVRFLPLERLKLYIQQHSNSALNDEWQQQQPSRQRLFGGGSDSRDTGRTFSVAFYRCPSRAGNVMHNFLNTVIWGMIHNRTTLWMYSNKENTEEECAQVLRRAPWLPSYEEWSQKLNLPEPVGVNLKPGSGMHQDIPVVMYPQRKEGPWHNNIRQSVWNRYPNHEWYQQYVAELPDWNLQQFKALHSEGVDFLYGMLYSELFTLQRETGQIRVPNRVARSVADDTTNRRRRETISLAIHSRHPVNGDDGSYINYEKECIEKLLPLDSELDCEVRIMSDRVKSLYLLQEYLTSTRNCTVVTANHDHAQGKNRIEHGPWAGAGFLEDLDVVSEANAGIIGDVNRSSTALLKEVATYRRKMKWWQSMVDQSEEGKKTEEDPIDADGLKICQLPGLPAYGYSYGPGTPLFKEAKYLDPLSTIHQVDEYTKGLNRAENITVSINLHDPSADDVGKLLNTFILGMLTNASLVVQDTNMNEDGGEGSCLSASRWLLDRVDSQQPRDYTTADDRSNKDGSRLDLQLSGRRYNTDDWMTVLASSSGINSSTAEQKSLLTSLYEFGPEVLYGYVFKQLFSICHKSYGDIIEDEEQARYSFLVEISSSLSRDETATRIGDAVEKLTPQDDWLVLEGPSSLTCHIYMISTSSSSGSSSNTDDMEKTSTAHQMTELDLPSLGRKCTVSLLSEELFESSFWQVVNRVSTVRTGWIRPAFLEEVKGNTAVQDGLLFIREQLEYKRHLETWEGGIVPFQISPLAESTY